MKRGRLNPALLALLLAVLSMFLLAACGDDDDDGGGTGGGGDQAAEEQSADMPGEGTPPVTIGTKDFTEEFVLGELYAQALEAKGYTVNLKKNIGSTEIIDKALTSGEIDGYPEYLGVSLAVAARQDIIPKSAEQTYNLAKEFYEGRGQVISEQTSFENVDAIATTQYFAQRRGLATVGDLRQLSSFSLGARPEFEARRQGLVGMREVYGLDNVEFEEVPIGEQYRALDRKEIDAANVFTTDGQLASGSYKVLEDDERVFGFQHVALVIDEDKLDELGGDKFMRIINDVNGRLTTSAMIQMNRDVDVDGQNPAIVAERFLRTAGLLE